MLVRAVSLTMSEPEPTARRAGLRHCVQCVPRRRRACRVPSRPAARQAASVPQGLPSRPGGGPWSARAAAAAGGPWSDGPRVGRVALSRGAATRDSATRLK